MLNNIWSNLVNEVESAKKRHEELEGAMTITNNHLNDGILALDARLDRLEDRFRTIRNVQDDVRTTVNKQQRQIYDMDSQISFYSGSIVQLEGKCQRVILWFQISTFDKVSIPTITHSLAICHRAIFYTHFSSFSTPFPLHFFGLFYSIRQISIPQQHTRSLSFLLPFLKTCKPTARQ